MRERLESQTGLITSRMHMYSMRRSVAAAFGLAFGTSPLNTRSSPVREMLVRLVDNKGALSNPANRYTQ